MRAPSASPPVHRVLFTSRTGVIVLLVAGILAALYGQYTYSSQRRTAAQEQADILAASVPAAVAFGDRAAAEEYVRPMRINPDIDAVGIYTLRGHLMTGFAKQSPLPAHVSAALWKSGVVAAVVERGTPMGWVYLRPSREPLLNQLERHIGLALLAAMAVLMVTGLGRVQRELRDQSERLAAAHQQLQNEMAERLRIEEALRQSQKMEAIGQLSGGIAHDLNNHLMIIRGNLDLLHRKLALPRDDKHYGRIIEGINRAANLTQRILGFSRKQSLSPTELDLNELIVGMAELFHNSLRENIEITYNLSATTRVRVDRNQMENVILNLVVNARDAMPDGGTVAISTGDLPADAARAAGLGQGDYVVLSVLDTGIGMTEEVRARALDPFFTTKPFGEGTGLGLSTASGFVTQSGGSLTITSAPQRGTSVAVYLPRSQTEAD